MNPSIHKKAHFTDISVLTPERACRALSLSLLHHTRCVYREDQLISIWARDFCVQLVNADDWPPSDDLSCRRGTAARKNECVHGSEGCDFYPEYNL